MPHHDTLDSGPCQSPDPGNCYQSRGKCQEQYGSQAAYSSAESYRSHAAYGRVQSYYPSRADVFGSGRSDDRPERSHASKDKGRHKKQKDKKTQRKKGKKEESGRDKMVDQILENATPRILDILHEEYARLETDVEGHYEQAWDSQWQR